MFRYYDWELWHKFRESKNSAAVFLFNIDVAEKSLNYTAIWTLSVLQDLWESAGGPAEERGGKKKSRVSNLPAERSALQQGKTQTHIHQTMSDIKLQLWK